MLLFPPKSCCFSRQNFGTSWLISCKGYLPFPSTTVCYYAQYIGGVRSKCWTFSHSYRTVLYMRLNRCCTVKTLYRKIWNKYSQKWNSAAKRGPFVGIYKSLIGTWMWKLGTKPRSLISGNIYIRFSMPWWCELYHQIMDRNWKSDQFFKIGDRSKRDIYSMHY